MHMAFHPSSRYATTCDAGALDITAYAFAPAVLEELNQSMLGLKRSLYRNGRKLAKLGVQVDSVENHRGRYRVTLRFLNAGE